MTLDEAWSDGAEILALYRRLFDALEHDGVDYCVWKNLNDLPAALAGNDDIDLYVRPCSRAAFIDALRAHGFVRIETHKAHPWVVHYYGLDEPSGTLCHLHCYFRLVTGESHVKQYVVPLERYLDALPASRNALGVREMHPWLQRKLYLLRHRIKLSCLPGAWLYHSERRGYLAERARLERHRGLPDEGGPIDGWPATIVETGPLHHEVIAGLAYRRRFSHWSRIAPLATPVVRYGVIVIRALGKLLGWRKTLPFGLLIVVCAGTERDGRTRRALDDWLGATFRLRSFQLPDVDGGNSAPRLLRRCHRRSATLRDAILAAAGGSLAICYGWNPSHLREALAVAASVPGTSGSARRALQRCAAELDDAAEPDMVLHPGDPATYGTGYPRAAFVEIGDDGTKATMRWRKALWQALVARQP